MPKLPHATLALALLAGIGGCAAPGAGGPVANAACDAEPARWARAAGGGCLALTAYGPARADLLVVVLHGDVSGGGPARYHRALAERVAAALPGAAVAALVRPGYPDGEGRSSDGDLNNRADHLTPANIALVAGAVEALRARSGARRVLAVGHSGGAATAADVLALHPGALDGAALLACPCDLARWRRDRSPWVRSVDPRAVADRVPASARVTAFTGTADDNTAPTLAEGYVAALRARGVAARFVPVPGASHNGVVESAWGAGLGEALAEMAR